MSDLDSVFRHPERANLTDAQFEMLLKARERERSTRLGLIAFLTLFGIIGAVIVTGILAANGVFGG